MPKVTAREEIRTLALLGSPFNVKNINGPRFLIGLPLAEYRKGCDDKDVSFTSEITDYHPKTTLDLVFFS